MPERIQRKRIKGWRAPEGAIYVGRGSKWGNPYTVSGETTATVAVARYRGLIERFAAGRRECSTSDGLSVWDRHVVQHIRDDLGGRDLMCWCPLVDADGNPVPCQADVLLALAAGGGSDA